MRAVFRRVGPLLRRELRRRAWLRRSLLAVVAVAVVMSGLMAIGSTGGLLVRDRSGCPRTIGSFAILDWIDAFRHDGRMYERVDEGKPAKVDRALITDQVGRVRCTLADRMNRSGYDFRDGEATFLEPGSPIHMLKGVDPRFRVVAFDDGVPAVYQHRRFDDAETGADLLPFAAESVTGIAFVSPMDGTTEIGRINDREKVPEMVHALQAAPVDRAAARDLPDGPRVFVRLEMQGQPPVTLVVLSEEGLTGEGLRVPSSVLEQLPPGQ